ncbi:MAG: MmgE/PrpD family protein [Acidobacteriota bacterium]
MSAKSEVLISRYLAELVHEIGASQPSIEDRALVRQHMLDASAASFIGRRTKVFDDLTKLCASVPGGRGWPGGGPERVHSLDAAMVWSFAIHASVFEDGSREGACHPAAAVVPTILALAEGRSWLDIDRAAIAGYDVMVRISRSGNPGFTRRGFHPTAIGAPFGAAATASLLLGYDTQRTQNALCLAAMGGSGLMHSFRNGTTQPLQVAWSVRSGLAAAMMGGCDHSGYLSIIEDAFYPAYLAEQPLVPVDKALEHGYAIRGSYLKPYPGCRHVHPSIDALAGILQKTKLEPSQVARIDVRTYKVAVESEIDSLKQRGDAYFNIPYALAARIVLGRCDWDAFDERHFTDRRILDLMKRVHVRVDPEVERLYPNQRGAIVEVHCLDEIVHSGEVNYALGEPESPLPVSMTRETFRQAAGDTLSRRSMDRVENMLEVSDMTDSAESLFQVMTGAAQVLGGMTK